MKPHSETEENYLKAIYKFSETGETVSTNSIARYLSTSPASVTDMLKKLAEKKLVDYQPYQGVKLTASGLRHALHIVRKHRLWEVFLVKVLNFSWDQIHETAEQLEHVNSPELISKLDAFLGYPKFDPHGDPIPSETGEMEGRQTKPLLETQPGDRLQMAGVLIHTPEFLQFLDKIGLTMGVDMKVVEHMGFDQSLLVMIRGKEVVVGGEVARNVLVLHRD